MNPILEEVIEELESWDLEPTEELIKQTLNKWIKNLYSQIGVAAHEHALACGIIDNTEMTWEEQDMLMLQQIERYKKCLEEIGGN